mmetsp:Transcript_8970/g.20912  ORF Transcript_8970/g.20912 Transcript_8970/m.20912 type:complete len:82 (-) Transcript_8970:70-315(-)
MGCGGSSMEDTMTEREERREARRARREENEEKERWESTKSEIREQGRKYREAEDRELAKKDRALIEEKKKENLHKAFSVKW